MIKTHQRLLDTAGLKFSHWTKAFVWIRWESMTAHGDALNALVVIDNYRLLISFIVSKFTSPAYKLGILFTLRCLASHYFVLHWFALGQSMEICSWFWKYFKRSSWNLKSLVQSLNIGVWSSNALKFRNAAINVTLSAKNFSRRPSHRKWKL